MNKIINNILFLTLLFLIIPLSSCANKKDTCEWIVKQYFLAPEFPDVKDYIAKEEFDYQLSHPTYGEIFKEPLDSGFIHITYRNIHVDSETSVYAVTLSSDRMSTDMYCHLHNREGKWKIHSVREVAMTGIYFAMIEQLDSLPSIPDSMLFSYNNAKLVVIPDKELKKYFNNNADKFNTIVEIYKKNNSIKKTTEFLYERKFYNSDDEYNADKTAISLMKELYIQRIDRENNTIKFLIGGILDNAVYIYYILDEQSPPKMNPNNNIYVEKIAPNWYIVKTT